MTNSARNFDTQNFKINFAGESVANRGERFGDGVDLRTTLAAHRDNDFFHVAAILSIFPELVLFFSRITGGEKFLQLLVGGENLIGTSQHPAANFHWRQSGNQIN